MANFPTNVTAFTTKNTGETVQAAHINDLQDEVAAIESGYRQGSAPLNSSGSTVHSLAVSSHATFGSSVPHARSFPNPSTRTGEILVYPPNSTASTEVGRVFLPDGTELNVSTSGTAGLQEAIDAASTMGADLHVMGGSDFVGSTIGGAVVYRIASTRTLHVPAMQGKSIRFGAVTLNFNGSDDTPCVIFDSQMMLDWDMRGAQIVATGRVGDGVRFHPSSNVPIDNLANIVDSRFRFHSIALTSTLSTGAAVRFNCTSGGINHSLFEFVEINGGVTGLLVNTPNSSQSLSNCHLQARHLHSQVVSTHPQIRLGESTTVRIAENVLDIGLVSSVATKPGMEIWGVRNHITLSMSGTAPSTDGIRFEASASGNKVFASRVLGGISNNATAHDNRVYVESPARTAAITVGASPQTYINKDCLPETLAITGGTISEIALTVNSTTFLTVSSLASVIPLQVGEGVRVTFSVAPTITRLLKGPVPGFST